jgi:hypothetical protein
MGACQAVLLTPANSFHPRSLLYRQHHAFVSPLAATLMDLPASVANKRLAARLTPVAATLTKNRGVGVPPFVSCSSELFCIFLHFFVPIQNSTSLFSINSALFGQKTAVWDEPHPFAEQFTTRNPSFFLSTFNCRLSTSSSSMLIESPQQPFKESPSTATTARKPPARSSTSPSARTSCRPS